MSTITLDTAWPQCKHLKDALTFQADTESYNSHSAGRRELFMKQDWTDLNGGLPSSWSFMKKTMFKAQKFIYSNFNSSLKLSQMAFNTNLATTPTATKCTITKVKIPIQSIPSLPYSSDQETINAEWVDYYPEKPQRVILYIHGGAYMLYSRKSHRMMVWRLAKHAKARVLSINYRLAPQDLFPAPLIDVLSAYLYLLKNPHQSFLPSQVCFTGDSAGGCLATSAMLFCRDTIGFEMPGAVTCMSPFVSYFNLVRWYPIFAVLVLERTQRLFAHWSKRSCV